MEKEWKKHFFDVVVAGMALIALSPLFLMIAVLIFVLDGETPFFVQTRVGKNGRKFLLIKFKTMKPGSPFERDDFQAGQTTRITSLGRLLRRTKLDELLN